MQDDVKELCERLQRCVDDPMWADHAEIPKRWCAEAHATIARLSAENEALLDENATLRHTISIAGQGLRSVSYVPGNGVDGRARQQVHEIADLLLDESVWVKGLVVSKRKALEGPQHD